MYSSRHKGRATLILGSEIKQCCRLKLLQIYSKSWRYKCIYAIINLSYLPTMVVDKTIYEVYISFFIFFISCCATQVSVASQFILIYTPCDK